MLTTKNNVRTKTTMNLIFLKGSDVGTWKQKKT